MANVRIRTKTVFILELSAADMAALDMALDFPYKSVGIQEQFNKAYGEHKQFHRRVGVLKDALDPYLMDIVYASADGVDWED